MATSDLVDLSGLMDDAKCFALVRQRRWPEGVRSHCSDTGRIALQAARNRTPKRSAAASISSAGIAPPSWRRVQV